MRVLTWNLERSGPKVQNEQHKLLDSLVPDLEVLAEAGRPEQLKRESQSIVASDPFRGDGESWVVIRGRSVAPCDFEIPFERMAAAATATVDGVDFLVYGSVLPWRAASSQAIDVFDLPEKGVPTAAIYGAWLTAQLRDIWKLKERYPEHRLLWLGDFNVPVLPPFKFHLPAGSEMVVDALRDLGLRVYNAKSPHRLLYLHTIDLICGPESMVVNAIKNLDDAIRELALSDHLLYYVDLDLSAESIT